MKKSKQLTLRQMRRITASMFIALIIVILLMWTTTGNAQYLQPESFGIFGVKAEYSPTFKTAGAGFFGGFKDGNSYFGGDTHIYFGRIRNVPVMANIEYGYSIGQIQPFIIGGFYTCGGEAAKENEGKQGLLYGGGISYLLKSIPIKFQAGINNVNTFFSIGFYRNL